MNDALVTTKWKSLRLTPPTAVETALATRVLALPSQAMCVEGFRGMRARFKSTGADNETATITVYGIDPLANGGYLCQSLGTLAITLGTTTGVAGTQDATGERYADTCTWTASTYGTALLTYIGGNAAAFSPADNTIAEFLISDFGNMSHLAFVVTTYGLTAGSSLTPIGKFDV